MKKYLSNSLNGQPVDENGNSITLSIYIHDFISEEGQQEFIIPEGYTINSVFLNRTFLISSDYTYIDNILTIIETLETGTVISTR